MLIGIPKETKPHEYRVGLLPFAVKELTSRGHTVLVETNAAKALNLSDEDYARAGAKILNTPQEVFANSHLIVKVKEPQDFEIEYLNENHTLFTYLHLASSKELTLALLDSKCNGIAYETITAANNSLPLLTPMSEIAGRISVQIGATFLEKRNGGKGILLSGAPGVRSGKVVIVGCGVVGSNALKIAYGMGAEIIMLDTNVERLRALESEYKGIKTVYSNQENILANIQDCDLLIGAVLLPGKSAPKVLTKEMISQMQKGSVFIDVAIDQGGCSETSKPTSYIEPSFLEDEVIHVCVTNLPGSTPLTSTYALNNATLPFLLEITSKGVKNSILSNPHLAQGLNLFQGKLTNYDVAVSLEIEHTEVLNCLKP